MNLANIYEFEAFAGLSDEDQAKLLAGLDDAREGRIVEVSFIHEFENGALTDLWENVRLSNQQWSDNG